MATISKTRYSIFIFRRDLRIKDNIGLNRCFMESDKIILLFIFDPKQIGNTNIYRSKRAIEFMILSLLDLQLSVGGKLTIKHGKPHKVIASMIENNKNISAVYFNEDYTPYSKKRDEKIKSVCKLNKIDVWSYHDILLLGELKYNKSQEAYKVFTAFYNSYRKTQISLPTSKKIINKLVSSVEYKSSPADIKKFLNEGDKLNERDKLNEEDKLNEGDKLGGRTNGLKLLSKVKNMSDYNNRDYLTYTTTRLSAHLNFGTISIREMHSYAKKINDKISRNLLIRQLFWRDFYSNIMNTITEESPKAFDKKWDIKWKESEKSSKWLSLWKKGNTGFPIVDAAMREINETGYMHNRARMIVASFLSKDMLIDWREGEKYFSNNLIDISITMNNMNWQNVVGCGPSAQPYFRVFNPWLQSKKYDKSAVYIKKWIPELINIPAEDIHNWHNKYKNYDVYLEPIFDHEERKKIYIKWIKSHI